MSTENNGYGTPFLQSLFLMKLVLDRLGEKVPEMAANSGLAPVFDIFPLLADNARAKLNEVGLSVNNIDVENKIILDILTEQSGLIPLARAYLSITPGELPAPQESAAGGEILEAAGSVFEKMSVVVEAPALVRSTLTAGVVLTIAGRMAKFQAEEKAAENYISLALDKCLTEKKLESENLGEHPPAGPDPAGGTGLTMDVEHIEPRGKRYVHLYPVKFMCGEMGESDGPLKKGDYSTSINIINILNQTVKYTLKASLMLPQGEGPDSDIEMGGTLEARRSIEISCADIRKTLGVPEAGFIKGFLIIETPRTTGLPQALEVVAVYSVLYRQN